ncbi:poly(A) RNA polymerase GLD2 [Xenentodon cancila]
MFHRDHPPRGLPANRSGSSPLPEVSWYHDYNHQRPESASSFPFLELESFPSYEWVCPPSTSAVVPPQTPVMTNGRKRQNNEYSPQVVKRQCPNFFPYALINPSLSVPPPPSHYPDRAVAESSRASLAGFGHSVPNPFYTPQPQQLSVPQSSSTLQPQQRSVPQSSSTLQPQQRSVPQSSSTLQPQQRSVPQSSSTLQPQQRSVPQSSNTLQPQQRSVPQSYNTLQPQQRSVPQSYNTLQPQQRSVPQSYNTLQPQQRSVPQSYNTLQPQQRSVPQSSNTLQAYAKDKLSIQMVELFEACQQQASDLERKERCRAQLQQDIQHIFEARLYLTGSSMNGLGCRSSDADLCLVIKENKKTDPISVLTHLKVFFRSLAYIEAVHLIRAKVPILRFKERGSNLEFDLNVNNTVGIRNTFLLRSYAYADLRVRPMILVVKKWARHHKINNASKGTLSSYTLVLMVLYYLQTRKVPVLSSLQRHYPDCFDPFMDIDTVPERPKCIPPYISRNQSSLGDLLLGFLKYYATEFSWDKHVISVRLARALPRGKFHEWRKRFICVEEPFERNNVARAVHEKLKFDAIKAQFAESCRILHAKRDLNSVLPVRDIINKESSRK